MSDTTGTSDTQNSLFTNLKNKLTYNLHKATYDPEANKFAETQQSQQSQQSQQTQQTQQSQQSQQKKDKNSNDTKLDSTDTNNNDPNKFSPKRLVKKVGNQTLDILQKIFYPFLALMLAMIVTNDMIMYSVPIRIIFFIFTFLVCYFVRIFAILLALFYSLKGGYSYYINNMTNRPKKDIMPTIFALLPITTFKPMSSLGSFLMYPFTYPKTESGAIKLPEIMKNYWNDLNKTFPSLNNIKNLPIVNERLKIIQKEFTQLHNNNKQMENENENVNKINENEIK